MRLEPLYIERNMISDIKSDYFSTKKAEQNEYMGKFENGENLNSNEKPSEKEIDKAVDKANKAFDISGRRLEFSVHKGTKEIIIMYRQSSQHTYCDYMHKTCLMILN